MEFTINSNKPENQRFNGARCKIINAHRDDGYIEVYIPAYSCMILITMEELDDQ